MPGGLGRRFLVEAAFIVAVAFAAAALGLGRPAIVTVMAGAWLLMAVVEWASWRTGGASRTAPISTPQPLAPVAAVEAPAPHVRILAPEAPVVLDRESEPEAELEPEPVPEPELIPQPEPRPVEAVEPEPEAEPEPEPVPVEPEPEPVLVEPVIAEPEPPRTWNLWELERLVRASSGADPVHDEELSFLLIYLRDFASADGVLPVDFDVLVRESFGDVLTTQTGT